MHSVQFNTVVTIECFLQFTLAVLHRPGTWPSIPFILYFNINFLPIALSTSLTLKSHQTVRKRQSLYSISFYLSSTVFFFPFSAVLNVPVDLLEKSSSAEPPPRNICKACSSCMSLISFLQLIVYAKVGQFPVDKLAHRSGPCPKEKITWIVNIPVKKREEGGLFCVWYRLVVNLPMHSFLFPFYFFSLLSFLIC